MALEVGEVVEVGEGVTHEGDEILGDFAGWFGGVVGNAVYHKLSMARIWREDGGKTVEVAPLTQYKWYEGALQLAASPGRLAGQLRLWHSLGLDIISEPAGLGLPRCSEVGQWQRG